MKIKELAYTRSGDKAANVNIGVIAFNRKNYLLLKERVSKEKILKFFKPYSPVKVEIYDLPNIYCFNIVLYGVLEKGGSSCLRVDSQGKAMGQALLEMEI